MKNLPSLVCSVPLSVSQSVSREIELLCELDLAFLLKSQKVKIKYLQFLATQQKQLGGRNALNHIYHVVIALT